MKKEVRNCLNWFLNRTMETVVYEKWSDEFCRKELNEDAKIFAEKIAENINFNNLTSKEALELGFKKWSEEKPVLYLFPLWLVNSIPEGLLVTDIFGESYNFERQKADLDTRFGCLAFGINVKGE